MARARVGGACCRGLRSVEAIVEATLPSRRDRSEDVGAACSPSFESRSACLLLGRIADESALNVFMGSSLHFVFEIAVDLRHRQKTLRSTALDVGALSRGLAFVPGRAAAVCEVEQTARPLFP